MGREFIIQSIFHDYVLTVHFIKLKVGTGGFTTATLMIRGPQTHHLGIHVTEGLGCCAAVQCFYW